MSLRNLALLGPRARRSGAEEVRAHGERTVTRSMNHSEMTFSTPLAYVGLVHPPGIECLAAEATRLTPCHTGAAGLSDDAEKLLRGNRRGQMDRIAEHVVRRRDGASPL